VRRAGKVCLIAKEPRILRIGLAIPGSHTLLFRQAIPARLVMVRLLQEQARQFTLILWLSDDGV